MAADSLQRYIEVKRQIGDLERELEELKGDVFSVVDAKGGEVADDSFVIRSYKKPKYKFSDNFETKNDELKQLRKSEIDDGVATIDGYSEFVTVRFKDK